MMRVLTIILAIIMFAAIAFAILALCKKAGLIRGAGRMALHESSNDISYGNALGRPFVKDVEDWVENKDYVNIVTTNPPRDNLNDIYAPAIYVQPDDSNIPKGNDNNCKFVKVGAYVFVDDLKDAKWMKHKVRYYHIDYGMSGEIYNTIGELMIIKEWLLPDKGYIVLGYGASESYLNMLLHAPYVEGYTNVNDVVLENNIAFKFDVIIPDNQHLINTQYDIEYLKTHTRDQYKVVRGHEFLLNDRFTMNGYENGEIKPYYLHNISYVLYLIHYEIYRDINITREEALCRWGLNEDMYNKLFYTRTHPNETDIELVAIHTCSMIMKIDKTYMPDNEKLNRVIIRLCNEFFLNTANYEASVRKYISSYYRGLSEGTNSPVVNAYAGVPLNRKRYSIPLIKMLTRQNKNNLINYANLPQNGLADMIIEVPEVLKYMSSELGIDKDDIMSAMFAISTDEYRLYAATKGDTISKWEKAMVLLRPIQHPRVVCSLK